MARAIAMAKKPVAEGAAALANRTEELRSRMASGMSRFLEQAGRSAKHVKDVAQELRAPTVLQQATAACERGNFEAAFWLFNEEFNLRTDDESVAAPYWETALALGRADIASPAGVKLVETRAAAGESELAARHWLELVKEVPDALVSPIAIATILPALKRRLSLSKDDGPEDPPTLAGYVRRAVQHAVDPRNTGLHPGVALRIFEEGREINPEASRRAAEAALESPHLHEAKRERLSEWLGGKVDAALAAGRNTPKTPATQETALAHAKNCGLSEEEIAKATARLRRSKSARPQFANNETPSASIIPRDQLIGIEDDALVVQNASARRAPERTD
jgi:hypothetical protein